MPPWGVALFEVLGEAAADTVLVMVLWTVVTRIEAAMVACEDAIPLGALWSSEQQIKCCFRTIKRRKTGRYKAIYTKLFELRLLENDWGGGAWQSK
jgi:hypothetical protein